MVYADEHLILRRLLHRGRKSGPSLVEAPPSLTKTIYHIQLSHRRLSSRAYHLLPLLRLSAGDPSYRMSLLKARKPVELLLIALTLMVTSTTASMIFGCSVPCAGTAAAKAM